MSRRLTDDARAAIIRLYRAGDTSIADVAATTGWACGTVHRVLVEAEVPRHRQGVTIRRRGAGAP